MPVSKDYLEYVLDQLARVTPVTSRRMFGGVGIYADGLIFALVDDDRVYFKVDDSNRADFEAVGMGPFAPMGDDRPMQYYELPGDLLDEPGRLRPWVEKATRVARDAAARKSKKKRKA